MKSRKFSLRSLVGKVFGKRPAPAVTLAPEPPPRTSARERVRSGIEPLEGRIAPAILLNPHTLIYTDSDGDKVKITFSKDLYDVGTTPTNLNEIFVFSAGATHIDATGTPNQTDDVPQQLQLINLAKVNAKLVGGRLVSRVAGISISVNADVAGSGDGFTKIGAIKAGNDALGTVKIDGDLGQIDAGNNAVKTGLERLEVQSIAKFGTTTQGTAPDLESRILGRLGALVVAGDVQGYIHVVTATTTTAVTQLGAIGSIVIGGSLIGGNAATGNDNTGRIDSAYDIGTVVIGNDPSEGIFGGAGENSGALTATHNIGTVTISGGITGGTVADAGIVSAGHAIGIVKVGGALTGGSGFRSGSIHSSGPISNVTISGSVIGGTVADAGTITAVGTIGFVKVNGALTGSDGLRSGSIRATGAIGSVSIGADITGGIGDSSGLIVTDAALGSVHVFGSISGDGAHSGGIFASGNIGSAAVEGGLTGGANGSGAIESLVNLGSVFIRGNVQGGDGAGSGSIIAASVLGQITLNGNLTGGKGANSGAILGGHDPAAAVRSLGSVTLLGALTGGEGVSSGSIVSGGAMGAVKVGRSLTSGVAIQGGVGALSGSIFSDGAIASVGVFRGIQGGVGAQSATIQAHGALGTVGIIGDVTGGAGESSGSIFSREISSGLRPIPGDIGTVVVIGKLMGTADRTALIQADGILGRATVGGIRGGAGSFSGAIVSGAGFIRPGATEFITVLGTVEGGAGAQSGSVEIGGQLGTFTATGLAHAGIRVANNIGMLRITGDVSDTTITARGAITPSATTDVAIGALQVVGNVSNTSIRAGYDIFDAPVNAHAQIGAVGVTGNWTASVLAAGVVPGTDGLFGTADDLLMDGAHTGSLISKIARVLIRGSVEGTPGAGDHFGFVAEQIASFSSNGALPRAAAGGQSFELGTNSDTTVRAVAFIV